MLTKGRLNLVSEVDRFPVGQPLVLKEDLSEVRFFLESDNPTEHRARLHVAGLSPGPYTISNAKGRIATLELKDGQESVVELPMDATTGPQPFTISRQKANPSG